MNIGKILAGIGIGLAVAALTGVQAFLEAGFPGVGQDASVIAILGIVGGFLGGLVNKLVSKLKV